MVFNDPLLPYVATTSSERSGGDDKLETVKGISFFGGFCLIFNNACGAGVASIPLVFATAGWVPAVVVMTFLWISSTVASAMVCETMCAIPGNANFATRVEFSKCVLHFMGHRSYIITQSFLFLSLQSLNIASIVISAQALDQAFVHGLGFSCGAGYHFADPSADHAVAYWGAWCTDHRGQDSPFGSHAIVVSFGYAAAAFFAVPLGILNLEDNINVQIVCMFLTFACIGAWAWSVATSPDVQWRTIPTVGQDQTQLIGTLLYNFAYVVTVPSWCNEKEIGVSVNRSLWSASSMCMLCYTFVGFLGAAAYLNDLSPARDLLACLNHSGLAPVAVYFFPIMAALSGVPIFCIILRCNLLEHKICTPIQANLLAVVVPWAIALCMQTGNGLQTVINWGSLLFSSVVNFVIPFLLYASYLWQCRQLTKQRCQIPPEASMSTTMEHEAFPFLKRKTGRSSSKTLLGLVYGLFAVMSVMCLESLFIDLDVSQWAPLLFQKISMIFQ
jgi:amino acid permease